MRITESDIAWIILVIFGLIGLVCEPWSPHPPLMAGVGSLYLVLRCAIFTIALMKDYLRSKNKSKGGTELCLRK